MSDFFEHEFGLKQLDCSQFKLSVAIKQFRSLKVSPYLLEDKKASLVTDRAASSGKQVFVVREGKTSTITINDGVTVYSLKRKINEKSKIPICRQRLVYEGRQLRDDKNTSEYKIEKESSIQLFIRGRKPIVEFGPKLKEKKAEGPFKSQK